MNRMFFNEVRQTPVCRYAAILLALLAFAPRLFAPLPTRRHGMGSMNCFSRTGKA